MAYKTIILQKENNIAKIIFNIPDRMNVLDLVMREELKSAFMDIENDNHIKAVIMTGKGKAFIAGSDIKTMEGVTAPAARDRLKNVQKLIRLMTELEKPIIAAVNGFATGAGLHIALACDMIIASDKAKFREAFVMIGLIPDLAGFYFLPLRVGLPKAKELMMTGRLFDAAEAESMGLVNRVVPHENLEKEVMDLAETLSEGPTRAYGMIKSALNHWPLSLSASLELEANLQSVAFATRDFGEGRDAFLAKRKPVFTGD
jgi:2-(1,2-epoxy-1,2-dihydrophenyl)acetyl-CoA isomerase